MTQQRSLRLLRHGNAVNSTGSDFDRALSPRGHAQILQMAGIIALQGRPDLIISSPALRAQQTTELLCQRLTLDQRSVVWEQRIYEAAVSTLLDVVSEIKQAQSVLLIGHNPGFEELVSFLSEADYLKSASYAIPTAGLVTLAMPDDWQKLDPGCAVLKQMNQPQQVG